MKRAMYMILALGLCALPEQTWAQGKGQANKQEHAQHGQKQQPGRTATKQKAAVQKQNASPAKAQTRHTPPQKLERGRSSGAKVAKQAAEGKTLKRDVGRSKVNANNVRVVNRSVSGMSARERAAMGAISHANRRGIADDAFVVTSTGDRVRVKNRAGRILLDMDDERARNMGHWDVRPLSNNVRSNAPSFCRSGAGHPVWGRQWCIDKGFGLGRYGDLRWGRASTIGDIIFGRRYDSGNLFGDVLMGVIGAVAYDRLALHAISLGYTDPLTGVWVGEPYGPRVLQLYSAGYPVAEIVDADRDDRADALVVALRL